MPPPRENAYNFVVLMFSPENDQTKNLKATYRRVQTLRIS